MSAVGSRGRNSLGPFSFLNLYILLKTNTTCICMSRYVATELASDIVINVGDVKFYLHKVRIYLVLRVMLIEALCIF